MTAVRRLVATAAVAIAAAGTTLLGAPLAAAGTADSAPPPVTVTSQPQDATVVEGQTASFDAGADCECTEQWQVSTDGGASWADVPGATSSPLSVQAARADDGNRYRDVFKPVDDPDLSPGTSDAATLTVNWPVTITQQPADRTVHAGDEVKFVAAADGKPAPTVQWQSSHDGGSTWQDVSGATSPALSFPASVDQDGWRFRAVFTNHPDPNADAPDDTAVTDAATLHVRTYHPEPGCYEEEDFGYCASAGGAGGVFGPLLTGPFSATFVEGQYGSVSIHAKDGARITDPPGWPAGVTFTPGNGSATISGTPGPGTAGTYRITLHATIGPSGGGGAGGIAAPCVGCEDRPGEGGDRARAAAHGETETRTFVLTVVAAPQAATLPVTGSSQWASELDVAAAAMLAGGLLTAAGRRRRTGSRAARTGVSINGVPRGLS